MAWLGLVVVLAVLVVVAFTVGRQTRRDDARAHHPARGWQIAEPSSHVEQVRRVPYDWQTDD